MLTGCTKGEDGDSGMSNVNAPSDMPYNGAFEINWTVDGQTVGTSTLEWMYTANILLYSGMRHPKYFLRSKSGLIARCSSVRNRV